jgi:hypothetical protein
MAEYLFAYGSLIYTDGNGEPGIPVSVSTIRRGWYARISKDKNSALGAILESNSMCNGILRVTDTQKLEVTDEREIQVGYHRSSLPTRTITIVNGNDYEIDRVWVYVTDTPELPTSEFPIAQSYLDVVLTGCLAINEEFAVDFIRMTDGWDHSWLDDRLKPRYPRAISSDHHRIDAVLQKVIPDQLAKRIPLESTRTNR